MKPLLLLLVGLALLLTTEHASALEINREVRIAVAQDAIPAERTAALQLQKYLAQVTGHQLEVVEEHQATQSPQVIYIGAGPTVKRLLPQIQWENLAPDTIVMQSVGDGLVLAGDRPRGTLYAVYQFLEDVVGCRWWTATEKTIPHRPTLKIPPQNVLYSPPFAYRQIHISGLSWQKDPEFQTILRQNGQHQIQGDDWGNHHSILGFVHTFATLLPIEKYFKQHPEWYPDPQKGYQPATASSRMPHSHQVDPCLANPAVLEEMTKNALALIAQNSEAGYISISQNDHSNGYCRCPDSMAIIAKEGTTGMVLDFVNKVAARIQEKYPHFQVETLAYHFTQTPPANIKPAPNVVVRLAPINLDAAQPLDSEANADIRRNLLAWKEVAPRLFIWYYATNFRFALLPHPNLETIAQDLRFMAQNHVTAVYYEADSRSNGVGDFVQLRAWLTAKLLWNPHLDQEALINEFLNGYYGPAAPYLREYLRLVHRSVQSQEKKLGTYNYDFSFLTLEVMNESTRLFDQAASAVAHDEVLRQRLGRTRLSLDFSWLKFQKALRKIAANENKPFLGPQDLPSAFARFSANLKKHGMSSFGQNGDTVQTALSKIAADIEPEAPLPPQFTAHSAIDIIDIPAALFTTARHAPALIPDQQASTGKAIKLSRASVWHANTYLDGYSALLKGDAWRAYAILKFQLKPNVEANSDIFRIEMRNFLDSNRIVAEKTIKAREVQNASYQTIELEQTIPTGNFQYSLHTTENPDVEAVFIDRLILVREE